ERRSKLAMAGISKVRAHPLDRAETHARARSGSEDAKGELFEVAIVVAGLLNLCKLMQAGIDGCPLGAVVLEQRFDHFGKILLWSAAAVAVFVHKTMVVK